MEVRRCGARAVRGGYCVDGAKHSHGGAGRLDSAVEVRLHAARGSLCLVFHEEDFMEDRNAVAERDLHERVGHGLGDQRGVRGGALQEHAERSHRVEGFLASHKFNAEWYLK
jgi:hypothetical protein